MALVKCKDCGADVSTDAKVCPQCGAQMKPKSNLWKWIVGLPVGGFVLLMVIASIGMGGPEEKQARRAYKLCLKNLETAPPGTSALISGTCAMMESEFISKYGSRH